MNSDWRGLSINWKQKKYKKKHIKSQTTQILKQNLQDSIMFMRPRGKTRLKPICKFAQHECLLVINMYGWVFIPRGYAATAPWRSAAWESRLRLDAILLALSLSALIQRKGEKYGFHSDSPTVPGAPSSSAVPQILEDSVDFLRTVSYRRCNSTVFWKVGHAVRSRGQDCWRQPLFLCLPLCFQEWLTVSSGARVFGTMKDSS